MRKNHHFTDQGLVLKKTTLKDTHQLVTLFTKEHGKLVLTAFGTKRLTSKRLSHLETGNVISFSWHEVGEYATLQETDLQYAHSLIKEDAQKLNFMYLIFFVLHKILPENEPETDIYSRTLAFLRKLHSSDTTVHQVERFLQDTLMQLGFLDEKQAHDPDFDVMQFVEGLIGKKIRI